MILDYFFVELGVDAFVILVQLNLSHVLSIKVINLSSIIRSILFFLPRDRSYDTRSPSLPARNRKRLAFLTTRRD